MDISPQTLIRATQYMVTSKTQRISVPSLTFVLFILKMSTQLNIFIKTDYQLLFHTANIYNGNSWYNFITVANYITVTVFGNF